MSNNKPLTLSQQQHLLALHERLRATEQVATAIVNAAKVAINTFIEYLEDEHGAPPGEGWTIRDIQTGFERPEAPPPEGKST